MIPGWLLPSEKPNFTGPIREPFIDQRKQVRAGMLKDERERSQRRYAAKKAKRGRT